MSSLVLRQRTDLGETRKECRRDGAAMNLLRNQQLTNHGGHSRGWDGSVSGETRSKVASHGSRSGVARRTSRGLGDLRIRSVRRAALDAREPRAVRALALDDCLVGLRPHVDVAEVDVDARGAVRADELDWGALHTVDNVAIPVLCRRLQLDVS